MNELQNENLFHVLIAFVKKHPHKVRDAKLDETADDLLVDSGGVDEFQRVIF